MMVAAGPCHLETRAEAVTLVLAGHWELARLTEIDARLATLGNALSGVRVIDASALHSIDTAGALALLRRLRGAESGPQAWTLQGWQPSHQRILEAVQARLPAPVAVKPAVRIRGLTEVGRRASAFAQLMVGHVNFLGRVASESFWLLRHPRSLRLRELVSQLGQTGVTAIPVVALVAGLIGVVFAYLLGLQASQYGANLFVVDGVALGMTREFSPLIVSTIVAGRSGAAFTAQLGTMRMTEEIDAIHTLGLSAEQVLVMPRVLALMITLPLLVFVGDIAGLIGAGLISGLMLDITPHTFIERLKDTLDLSHVLIGLGKAPWFALVIAIIGCRMGMEVSRDTRSIGLNTTSTVVQGIVAVILLDAVFAVLFERMGW